jgi:hypothetical protein
LPPPESGPPVDVSRDFLRPPVIEAKSGRAELLSVFNPHGRRSSQSVTFLVAASRFRRVCVTDAAGSGVRIQVGPYFNRCGKNHE